MFDGYCPLYARLTRVGAETPEILALADHARPGQAPPLLLLDVVHYLLRENRQHDLARFYLSLTPNPAPPEAADEPYRDFCRQFQDRLVELLPQRQVQTNEVRRAATLVPLLGVAWERVARRPLALIALGASGGLLLELDRYGYDYGPAGRVGDPDSKLQLTCEVRGPVPIPARIPALASRVGIDLNPIDVRDPAQRRWLAAQIWPTESYAERLEHFEQAVAVTAPDPPRLVRGDVLTELPGLVAQVPPDQEVCLMHSYTTYEMPAEVRAQLARTVADLGQGRSVLCLGLEWDEKRVTWLTLEHYAPGCQPYSKRLGHAQVHGEWVEWLGPAG